MARKRGGGGGDEGGNWMDTYGDLVTLLLTFFVLLYSMSSLDQSKWRIFVQSIYPDAAEKEVDQVAIDMKDPNELAPTNTKGTIVGDENIPINDVTQEDMKNLYLTIANKLNESGIKGVTASGGEDYTFIIFRGKTFFEGDSSVLTDEGKKTLDVFCDTIGPFSEEISQVNIMGHTAQGDPKRPNTIRVDRMLSVDRAAEVCIYIQEKNIFDPAKLVNLGYGQFRPLASNDTSEGRAENRRVEILLIDKDAEVRSLDEYYQDMAGNVNADRTVVTDGSGEAEKSSDQKKDKKDKKQDDVSLVTNPDVSPQREAVSSTMSPISDDDTNELQQTK